MVSGFNGCRDGMGKAKIKKALLSGLSCDPEAIRTPDPQLRRLLLYPAELPDRVQNQQSDQDYNMPAFAVAKVNKFYLASIPHTKTGF